MSAQTKLGHQWLVFVDDFKLKLNFYQYAYVNFRFSWQFHEVFLEDFAFRARMKYGPQLKLETFLNN